jgi:hypothetical protein
VVYLSFPSNGRYQLTVRISNALAFALVLLLGLAISCKSGNQPPVVGSFNAPDTVYPGTDHLVSCTATDPESDPITLTWTCNHGTLTPDTGSSVNWHSPDSSCTAKVTVKAKDSHEGEGSYSKDIVVTTAANRPPVISGIAGPDSVDAGGNADLSCSATDPDADTLTYAWTCSVGPRQRSLCDNHRSSQRWATLGHDD